MFELSLGFTLIACLIVVFASVVQTAIGFGLALIAVPLLVLIDPAMVPAPIMMVAFVQATLSARSHRVDIQWRLVGMALIGRVPGTLVAMALMAYFGHSGIKVFIAIGVLIAVLLSLFKISLAPNRNNHLIAGFLSGLTGTTSGMGGPPMAILYQHKQGDFVRANLSAYFVVGSLLSLAGMAGVGYVTMTSWLYGGLFIPSIFIGVWLGLRVKKWLHPAFMRPAILIMCSASALAVLMTMM